MIKPISITAISSLSALGSDQDTIWGNYLKDAHFITERAFENGTSLVAQISKEDKQEIEKIKQSDSKYKHLDASVLYGLLVARKAIKKANWKAKDNFGINIGSSRGATSLFELSLIHI